VSRLLDRERGARSAALTLAGTRLCSGYPGHVIFGIPPLRGDNLEITRTGAEEYGADAINLCDEMLRRLPPMPKVLGATARRQGSLAHGDDSMTYLGLNLGLKKVGENAQVLWNDGGQGRS
jgi:hypothetical protein